MKAVELDNGLKVVLVPCEAESVAVGFFIASGSRHETKKSAGISHFIEHMLFKGTPTRSPLDISRAIEGRGGNFNACTGEDSTCYYCHLPCEYLTEAIDILSDMYLNATIPEDEFAREKEVVIEEIKMYADEPDSVALEKLQKNLFPQSQLGEPIAGSEKSLRPLTSEDLRKYIRSHYRVGNTVVVVAGNFDELKCLKALGALSGLNRSKRPLKCDVAIKGKVIPHSLVTKDIQQAQLALGYRTFGIGDERKYAATLLDAVLGRGMSSRLFQEVREKRGLSYDISSRLQFFQDAGMISITAGMDMKKRDLALKTIDRELLRVCEKKVGSSELDRTKEFLIGNFRLTHEKIIAKMFYHGAMYLAFGRVVPQTDQIDAIRSVTAEDVRSVACDIFSENNRSVSWVTPKV